MPGRMTRRRLPRILLNAATAVSLVLCTTLACHRPAGGEASAPVQPPRPPGTRSAVATPAPPPGLLGQLRGGGYQFASLLPQISDVRAPGTVNAERRDAHFAELTRLAAKRVADVRLLVVEAVDHYGHTGTGEYDRVGLFHVVGGDDPRAGAAAYERLGLIRVDDPERWRHLSHQAGLLLDGDAPLAPEKPIFDAFEAAIVSRFDGRGWTSRSWFYLLIRAEQLGIEGKRPADLPPETRAAVNLFQLVDRSLGRGRPPPFAEFWAPFVGQFGEFPAPAKP
jgi:hypothetical protein